MRTYVRRGASLDERLRHTGWSERVVRPALGPCWEWNGGTSSNGYGKLFDGCGTASAHRVAYTAWVGEIPEGLNVLHRCDNRRCIRPQHLFVGTTAENAADMRAKGRQNDPVRLTDADVVAIRAAYTGRRGEQTVLATAYGVSLSTISLIVRGLHRASAGGAGEHGLPAASSGGVRATAA